MELENQNAPVGHSDKTSGDVEKVTTQKDDVVQFSSFQKALEEKKRAQAQATEMKSELEILREEKLKREGKFDEVNIAKDKKIAELEKQLGSTKQSYAWSTLTGEIKREAIKNNCTDPDKLIRLMSDDDLKELSQNVNEDFTINTESLKTVMEKNKKENFFLFTESKKKQVNGNPKAVFEIEEKTDLSKLSLEELKELHKKSFRN